MAISGNRMSNYTQVSTSTDSERPKSGDIGKKDMWSSMLDGVASGKRLPEKNIIVLGGSPDTQKEFLDSLSSDNSTKRTPERHGRKPAPIANNFALGYTYLDVLDADHEDNLARLSVYFLGDPAPTFTSLLRPLLNPVTIPNTLITVLLDWSHPWLWLRQLRDWIRLLRALLVSLDTDCKTKMQEVMINWRDRGRGTAATDGNNASTENEVNLPLGPGEWEEALGLPLCVVCQNSDQMEVLEKERGWKEEEFDFVLQFLRTVLLKHGASLIYTIPAVASPLPTLIHSSLNIQSLLKKQPLRHNVIDRDKVLVPPNWDSWGKIRVLREGFDVEGINQGWSLDIEGPPSSIQGYADLVTHDATADVGLSPKEAASALTVYEDTIQDPGIDAFARVNHLANNGTLGLVHLDAQAFLSSQVEALERIRHGAEAPGSNQRKDTSEQNSLHAENGTDQGYVSVEEGRVSEHIGPVQFNMGGIQVDADDMLQRLKERQIHQTPEPETSPIASPEGKSQNEALASFFAGLMKRGGGSAANSPKPGGQ